MPSHLSCSEKFTVDSHRGYHRNILLFLRAIFLALRKVIEMNNVFLVCRRSSDPRAQCLVFPLPGGGSRLYMAVLQAVRIGRFASFKLAEIQRGETFRLADFDVLGRKKRLETKLVVRFDGRVFF